MTETLRTLFSMFPHCWNWTKTYTSGFCWRKLDGIHLKLYYSIAETILETSSPSFYIVSAVFQFCWNFIFHPLYNVYWLNQRSSSTTFIAIQNVMSAVKHELPYVDQCRQSNIEKIVHAFDFYHVTSISGCWTDD